jgi:hypothetical protein
VREISLALARRTGHYALVGGQRRWRVQAFWRVGTDQRSYAPVFVVTEAEARDVAADMAQTLSHFVDLDVRVDEVEADPVNADEQVNQLSRYSASQPLLHALGDERSGTLCGVPIDTAHAALTADMLAQADGLKCPTCTELLRPSPT